MIEFFSFNLRLGGNAGDSKFNKLKLNVIYVYYYRYTDDDVIGLIAVILVD